MLLAERAAPTGDYELMALAQAGDRPRVALCAGAAWRAGLMATHCRPIRDRVSRPIHQCQMAASPSATATTPMAISTRHPAAVLSGRPASSCATPPIQTLAAALAANGSLYVNGLQGNGIGVLEPANVPPLLSYFVDYNALADDPAARGHMGDIAIPANCAPLPRQGQVLAPGVPLPASGLPPVVYVPRCPFGELQTVNGRCHGYGGCPPGEIWNPRGQIMPSAAVLHERHDTQRERHLRVPGGSKHQRRHHPMCVRLSAGPDSSVPPPAVCAVSCPGGQIIDGGTIKCVTTCPQGQAVNPTTGSCGPIACPPGYEPGPNGTCTHNPNCPPGQTPASQWNVRTNAASAAGPDMPARLERWHPLPTLACRNQGAVRLGQTPGPNGICLCLNNSNGIWPNALGACINLGTNSGTGFPCAPGWLKNRAGVCVLYRCPAGQTL